MVCCFIKVKMIPKMYTATQKKKVATYARFHGGRAAAEHFKMHHKNVQRWLKEEMDTLIVGSMLTRKAKEGR